MHKLLLMAWGRVVRERDSGKPRLLETERPKSVLGKGWGAWGKDDENAFSRSAAKRLGPPA